MKFDAEKRILYPRVFNRCVSGMQKDSILAPVFNSFLIIVGSWQLVDLLQGLSRAVGFW